MVGVAAAEALFVGAGGALVEDPAFTLLEEPDPSVRTSATTTTTTAAAATAGISHFGRLRGARGLVPAGPPGEYHSPGTSGWGPPGCWPPHHPPGDPPGATGSPGPR